MKKAYREVKKFENRLYEIVSAKLDNDSELIDLENSNSDMIKQLNEILLGYKKNTNKQKITKLTFEQIIEIGCEFENAYAAIKKQEQMELNIKKKINK